ncbi:MAG: molybdenum cofactor biosynthesis protein MoaE [Thermodesulfobacteriota bacterium]
MKVNVLLFGRLMSIAGVKELTLCIDRESCSVREMTASLFGIHPQLSAETFRVVVNQSVSQDDDRIGDSDEVALLPPISGGNFTYLTNSPITFEFVESVLRVRRESSGSFLIFEGIVRNDHTAQKSSTGKAVKRVVSITYSAYEEMAEREINKIVLSAMEKFRLHDVVLRHRIGEVNVGETAFFVAVSSGHRKESIAGIDFIIDEVKSKVPVWKLENYDDGTESWKDGKLIGPDAETPDDPDIISDPDYNYHEKTAYKLPV